MDEGGRWTGRHYADAVESAARMQSFRSPTFIDRRDIVAAACVSSSCLLLPRPDNDGIGGARSVKYLVRRQAAIPEH